MRRALSLGIDCIDSGVYTIYGLGSLLPPTPLHKGQNAHFAYEATPKLDIYFLYLEVLHTYVPTQSCLCISVAMKVHEERVNAALGVNPQF